MFPMIKGGKGGSKTTKSGLTFEKRVDLRSVFQGIKGYSVNENKLFFKGKLLARLYKKYDIYKKFLPEQGIDWALKLSKKLLPDEAIFVLSNKTLFIIEMKFQEDSRFVYEDLQTCRFKKIQFTKLLDKKGMNLEYIYFLDNHFKHSKYKDILDYVHEVGCHYFFEELPLNFLGFEQTR